jgi:hypothetical protein
MTKQISVLSFLEDKVLGDLDFLFLNKIKPFLPYSNPYFLVCLAEVIQQEVNSQNHTAGKAHSSLRGALEYFFKKAEDIYLNTNISESLAGNN